MPARVVLVTGVSRYLGGRFARELSADPSVERVIGVDLVPPPHNLGGAEFVRADIRNPVIAKVIASAAVDTVVHMSVIATPASAGGRSLMKEVNVIGTMQLLAACQKAGSVKKLVVKSSSTVYGASPKDPALFSEEMEPRALSRSKATSGGSPVAAPMSWCPPCASRTAWVRTSTPRCRPTSSCR
jgi:UDP-glucose 4-epimerase